MSDFSIENVDVVINDHRVTGWSDDGDALAMPDVELASVVRGADGQMTSSSTGEKGGPVTLKLLPNSNTTKFLNQIVTSILNGGSVEINGFVKDNLNGIYVELSRGVIMTAPLGQTMGKGETANREFIIEFEKVIPDYSGASF